MDTTPSLLMSPRMKSTASRRARGASRGPARLVMITQKQSRELSGIAALLLYEGYAERPFHPTMLRATDKPRLPGPIQFPHRRQAKRVSVILAEDPRRVAGFIVNTA